MKIAILKQSLLAITALISTSLVCFADAPQTQCDIETTNKLDPARKAVRKDLSQINAVEAIEACKNAIKRFPNEARFQFQMGLAFRASNKNDDAAVWYQKAASQGYAAALANLGIMYQNGWGLKRDPSKAMSLFQKAMNTPGSGSLLDLVSIYDLGWGVNQYEDYVEFAPSYQKVQLRFAQAAEGSQLSWAAYSKRSKSLLEEILNYTTNGVEEGSDGDFWISGLNGAHQCIMSRIASNYLIETLDLRNFNRAGFRITTETERWRGSSFTQMIVGDERMKIGENAWSRGRTVTARLQKAWGLAFDECPSKLPRKF